MTHKEMANIKFNAIANYFGQGYTIAVMIICMPLYLQYLGAEAYGLVGFFMIMQNWLNLLDLGLSATLCRQVSFARGQISGFKHFNNLLRSFEIIFITLAMIIVLAVYFKSNWLAYKWIKAISLNPESISYCISIMGIIIGLRFFSTLYRGGIIGFEDQIWLNKAAVAITSLKYVGAFLILAYISNDIELFFEYQLVIAALEVVILGRRFYYDLPSSIISKKWFKIDWTFFREILPFSMSITYTSAVALIVSQFDKLLLSGLLSLKIFGYFSIITIISGGLISLSIPIFTAFQPRITMLAATESIDEMISLYIDMTEIVTWIVFSTAMLIVIYPQEILYSLTGDNRTYIWGGEVLQWYVLGSSAYVMGSCQYYLQNAFGKLGLYVKGMTLSLVMQAPLIYWVTTKYGAIGASQLWFVFSLIWFLGFTWVVHSRFIPKFHFKWLFRDILPVLLCITALAYIINNTIHIDISDSRMTIFSQLAFISVGFFIVTSTSVSLIRTKVVKKLINR
jgi:O-antigen/teichoic acid export membrane protein